MSLIVATCINSGVRVPELSVEKTTPRVLVWSSSDSSCLRPAVSRSVRPTMPQLSYYWRPGLSSVKYTLTHSKPHNPGRGGSIHPADGDGA